MVQRCFNLNSVTIDPGLPTIQAPADNYDFLLPLSLFLSFAGEFPPPFQHNSFSARDSTTTSKIQPHWLRVLAAWRRLKLKITGIPTVPTFFLRLRDFFIRIVNSIDGRLAESASLVKKRNLEIEALFFFQSFGKLKWFFYLQVFRRPRVIIIIIFFFEVKNWRVKRHPDVLVFILRALQIEPLLSFPSQLWCLASWLASTSFCAELSLGSLWEYEEAWERFSIGSYHYGALGVVYRNSRHCEDCATIRQLSCVFIYWLT